MENFFSFIPQLIDALMKWLYPQTPDSTAVFNHVPEATVAPTPPPTPVEAVTSTPTPSAAPVAPTRELLVKFCSAIRDFEGLPGDRNYRNNNPGNVKASPVGYAPLYGKVGVDKDNFAVFRDYATGWLYLQNYVLAKVKKYPQWTILDFFNHYAPESDNNPTKRYAEFVAHRCGVDIHTNVKSLFV